MRVLCFSLLASLAASAGDDAPTAKQICVQNHLPGKLIFNAQNARTEQFMGYSPEIQVGEIGCLDLSTLPSSGADLQEGDLVFANAHAYPPSLGAEVQGDAYFLSNVTYGSTGGKRTFSCKGFDTAFTCVYTGDYSVSLEAATFADYPKGSSLCVTNKCSFEIKFLGLNSRTVQYVGETELIAQGGKACLDSSTITTEVVNGDIIQPVALAGETGIGYQIDTYAQYATFSPPANYVCTGATPQTMECHYGSTVSTEADSCKRDGAVCCKTDACVAAFYQHKCDECCNPPEYCGDSEQCICGPVYTKALHV